MVNKKKKILILATCDTKGEEVGYLADLLRTHGEEPFVIDISTGKDSSFPADVSREELFHIGGFAWHEIKNEAKGLLIKYMTESIVTWMQNCFTSSIYSGIISFGGAQNTMMGLAAMKVLPLGFPKVLSSTVANGLKTFKDVIGNTDITVIPAICDFSGLNYITKSTLNQICGTVVGQIQFGAKAVKKERKNIALTMMGVTNYGAMGAVKAFQNYNLEVLGFHATGSGGQSMERLYLEDNIDYIFDLTPHEVVTEYFKCGYSYADGYSRLTSVLQRDKPYGLCLGGVDFIDIFIKDPLVNLENRKYNNHNPEIYHVKILPEEAKYVADLLVKKLNSARCPLIVLIPDSGMRHDTEKGGNLYDPEVDRIITSTIRDSLNEHINQVVIPGNLDTVSWGYKAAEEFVSFLQKHKEHEL